MSGIELNWQCWQLNCNELKSAMPAIGNVVGNWQQWRIELLYWRHAGPRQNGDNSDTT
jgi:hypothetical protein